MGEVLTRLDRRSEAIVAYKSAIALSNGQIPMARIKLGRLLFIENDLEGAIEAYRGAMRSESFSTSACIGLGVALSAGGKYREAAAVYGKALSGYLDLPCVRLKLVESYAAIGQLDKAMTEIDDLLKFRRRFAEAHLVRGNILLRRRGDQPAIEGFQHALVLQPGLARAHLGLGMVYLRREERRKAIFEYHAALSDEQESSLAKRGLEIAYLGSVDGVEALVSDYLAAPLTVSGLEDELLAMLPKWERQQVSQF
jgi:tetratricopeptide (TPR) repeat protein